MQVEQKQQLLQAHKQKIKRKKQNLNKIKQEIENL